MTEDEFIVKAYKDLLKLLKEELADSKRTDGVNGQLIENRQEMIERLNRIIPEISEIYDIYSFEEEDFLFAVEALEFYAEGYIVDGTNEKALKKSTEEYELLMSIIDQFYDDEDDEYDDEEGDDEE